MKRRALTALAGGTALCLGLSGCGLSNGLYNVPLPGGANLGSHPFSITAQFADALDLVPQSGVKVNDVAVGRVTKITLEPNGKIADVEMSVNDSVKLPSNAVASIQQTSLLGEKYVSLGPPVNSAPTGRLVGGDTIGISQTTDGVEVEQLFGALSLVLNGGGIGQLHDIYHELNRFAGDREPTIRQFLASTNKVIGQFDRNRGSITHTLDALSQLSDTLRSDNDQIAQVLRAFSPGIAVLARQRKQLVTLLTALNNLGTVTTATLRSSKQEIVEDLQLLGPILDNLAKAGDALPRSLQVLLTYPFPDAALRGLRGDYLNGFATTAFNTPGGPIIGNSLFGGGSGSGTTTAGTQATATGQAAPPPTLLPSGSSISTSTSSTSATGTSSSDSSSSSGTSSSGTSSSGTSSSGTSSSGSSSSGSSSSGSSSDPSSGSSSSHSSSGGSSSSGSSSAKSSGGGRS